MGPSRWQLTFCIEIMKKLFFIFSLLALIPNLLHDKSINTISSCLREEAYENHGKGTTR
jgi:hypothetical protein